MNAWKLVAAFAIVGLAVTWASADQWAPRGCPECGCKTCVATPETTKVKKHCWEVECKDICIPRFRWPWESCCEPACARVKTVKVLKKKEYECEKCGYKWTVQSVCEPCQDHSDKVAPQVQIDPSAQAPYPPQAPVSVSDLPARIR